MEQPDGYLLTFAHDGHNIRAELYRAPNGRDYMCVLCPTCGFSALAWKQGLDEVTGVGTITACNRCGKDAYSGRRFYANGFSLADGPRLEMVLTVFFTHFLGLDPLYSTLAAGLVAAQFYEYSTSDNVDPLILDLPVS